jgi:hypothetical protein
VIETLSVTSLCYFISVGHFRGSTGEVSCEEFSMQLGNAKVRAAAGLGLQV